jgi:oligopeptide/dipeptide ABC transporter ATP-binding protein
MGLLSSMPRIDGPRMPRLAAIPGTPLSGVDRPAGCTFAPRCAFAHDACGARPELLERFGGSGHTDACVLDERTRTAARPGTEASSW